MSAGRAIESWWLLERLAADDARATLKRRRGDDDEPADLTPPTALKRARGADGAARPAAPRARERAVHMTRSHELECFLSCSVRAELERRYAERRPEDAVYDARMRILTADNYFDFTKRARPHVMREVVQSIVDNAAISCTGRALVAYLDGSCTDTDDWLSAFRRLLPLVSDVENDISEFVHHVERRRQVERIVKATSALDRAT